LLGLFSITFPIFATIALGYGAVRAGVFAQAELRVLGRYVLNIALPALLFNAVATRDLSEVLNPAYLGAYAAAGLGAMGLGYGLFAALGVGPARRAVAALGMGCPNSGYVGYPVLLLAMPQLAGVVLAMNVAVESLLLLPTALTLMAFSRDRAGQSPIGVALGILRHVLTRPLMIGFLAGLAVSVSGLPLPEPVARLAGMLAASASALALFVVGGTLVGMPMTGNRTLATQIAAGKLLLHPALAAGAAALLTAAGLVLPADLHAALVLSTAMPMLGIYAVLAQDYGHEGLAALALLMATLGAFVTVTALLGILT
jgi:malonate transporter